MADEAQEPEVVQGEVVDDGPAPEMKPVVDDYLPDVVVADDTQTSVMLAMDNADLAKLLSDVQSTALRKWVYELPGNKGTGLTVHAVQDITQRMNWTGKAKIGVMAETLTTERIVENAGNGPEPFWVATIFARDEVTGAVLPGSSMEPVNMKLRKQTADKKRAEGAVIPDDNRVFDPFSRTKAIQKATRNALAAFIPEEIEQTVIAMFTKDTSRVERIQTAEEAKVDDLPPALTDDRALGLMEACKQLYAEIGEIEGGQGKVAFPPGQFNAWMMKSQHSHDALERFVAYLQSKLEELPAKIREANWAREAEETAVKVPCPVCEAGPGRFCKDTRGSHRERMQARYDQLAAAS